MTHRQHNNNSTIVVINYLKISNTLDTSWSRTGSQLFLALNVNVCDFINSVFVRSLNLGHIIIIINCSGGSFVACIKGYKLLLQALPQTSTQELRNRDTRDEYRMWFMIQDVSCFSPRTATLFAGLVLVGADLGFVFTHWPVWLSSHSPVRSLTLERTPWGNSAPNSEHLSASIVSRCLLLGEI